MRGRSEKETLQLCWNCKKACGGCSWSEIGEDGRPRYEPIPGWDAFPTVRSLDGLTTMESYCIRSCPEYDPEPPRQNMSFVDTQRIRGLTMARLTTRQIAVLMDISMADVRRAQADLKSDGLL